MPVQRSNEDQAVRISKSIFVTNFPDNLGSKELWKVCEGYGKVFATSCLVSRQRLPNDLRNNGAGFRLSRINLAPLLLVKRCAFNKTPESILEKFKVIFKGKVFVARAKELFTWNPSFLEPKESVYTSDDESKHGAKILNDGAQNSDVESDDECNVDGVRDASTSLSHPPGFTPKTSVTHANVGEICEDGPTNGEDLVIARVDA
ncbi:hypothetical protein Tco_1106526 [Tanacetum coccineum]